MTAELCNLFIEAFAAEDTFNRILEIPQGEISKMSHADLRAEIALIHNLAKRRADSLHEVISFALSKLTKEEATGIQANLLPYFYTKEWQNSLVKVKPIDKESEQ